MNLSIGVDVGNYDTKTQETNTPSSYKASKTPNHLATEYIYYEGIYYSPTNERNNQQLDKTVNDYCIIMSLFGIAKETIWQIKTAFYNANNREPSFEEIQAEINKIDLFNLGVGLPAGHYSSLAVKLVDCYNAKWANGFRFEYFTESHNYTFNLRLKKCSAFPQDFTGVAFNDAINIVRTYDEYYIIGIGGGTADVIPVEDGAPSIEKCRSFDLGSTVLYEYISSSMQQETGFSMKNSTIEKVLNNVPTIVDEQKKKRIFELTTEYVNKMVDEFLHIGLKLSDIPCVFVGGGALLMRRDLERNPLIAMSEFVEDTHINAKYYAAFVSED